MIKFYFDINVPGPIYDRLTERGLDILRGQDDGQDETEDLHLLRRTSGLGRVLVTGDYDFLRLARNFQNRQDNFPGVIFFRFFDLTLGKIITDLETIANAMEPSEVENRVLYLPL